MADTADSASVSPDAGRGAALEYYVGAAADPRPAWEVAPRRCIALAVAWAVTILALFLPGCDMGAPGPGSIRPTYVVYPLTAEYTLSLGQGLHEAVRGRGGAQHILGSAGLPVACPLFLLGSAVFLLTPRLLGRRVRRRLSPLDWSLLPLLLGPWALPIVAAADGNSGTFLYGYYLLAAGHTVALVAITWPRPRPWPVAVARSSS